ncbi:hypothetical protein [Halalkalicoccus jeotgali]|uniref:DUF7967 domain-containing protein n=1 Tax=Halalkalicoccus jeotgali (strain DSM 18796 / CECT 7217 / JCM 14584 / KCTC 4019 / B3) TaxID=795797 RepID=D8JBB3_HALJB|nr:hypothetical protein [Halalkalicoccus jeotgali]ADJ16566.1 hypothetical protein HacjB3_16041 [Halalkalicoccus jeotgali B3]ELY41338.1 hypothetical protein C497_01210 [Halalkalicoccus jeotgali B3]
MGSKSDKDGIEVWLVERGYNDRDLIILKYATPSGERVFRREVSSQALDTVTAAKTVAPGDLASVDESAVQKRYASEVERMKEKYEPADPV